MGSLAFGMIVAIVVCFIIAPLISKKKEDDHWKDQGRKKIKVGDHWYWV